METVKLLKERFDLDIALLRMRKQKNDADAALRQAKFNLREAQQEQVLYGSTFKHFLDKLAGKQEEKKTALRHAVQRAEAELTAAMRSVSEAEETIPALEQRLSMLPPWETLRTAETEPVWYRLEAILCAEAVLPLLELNRRLLLERRNQLNGSNAGQIKTAYELAGIITAPEKAGDACKPYILRLNAALEALDMHLPDCGYFQNPAAYLNTATKYTRFDRLSEAITQTESLLRHIPTLTQQLQQDTV